MSPTTERTTHSLCIPFENVNEFAVGPDESRLGKISFAIGLARLDSWSAWILFNRTSDDDDDGGATRRRQLFAASCTRMGISQYVQLEAAKYLKPDGR